MHALVYTGTQKIDYRKEKDPTPKPGESIIKVQASGICGSDMHAFHGQDERRVPPLILGHEISGKALDGKLKDKNVVVNPLISCDKCEYCKNNREHLCPERTMIGMRISLFIGLGGVFFSFVLGCLFGGISGYFGGFIDNIIQRMIDVLLSIPTIPLWMALAAAIPRDWTVLQTYFAITMVLAIVGWAGLARVVRGKLLALREEDYILAAQIAGVKESKVITTHLLPNFFSYLIVHLTLAIPATILGETALSFLGLGIQPPAVSWGSLLKDAQDLVTVAERPWQLIPGAFVVFAVLMFNFIGDGLRDAIDPKEY